MLTLLQIVLLVTRVAHPTPSILNRHHTQRLREEVIECMAIRLWKGEGVGESVYG